MSETEQVKVEQPAEDKKEQPEQKEQKETKVEAPEHQEHEHDHDHPHDHEHPHDHDHPHDHAAEETAKKSNRGEKKFKKAMLKLGMKQVTGINRVTIKKTKSLLLYIDNPEVLKSAGQDNSYIIFGEAKIHDMPGNIASEEAKKFAQPEKATEEAETKEEQSEIKKEEGEKKEDEKKGETKPEEKKEIKEVEVSEEQITMVMEHTKCTREKAIDALKKSNNDAVNAIMELTG